MYKYVAIGAAQALETRTFYLGGPATTGLHKDWIMKLAQSGYRLDFLSWHTQSYEPGRFTVDNQHISSWLVRYPEVILLPKLITESGFTGSKDSRNGTQFAAAYAAAVFRQLANGNLKGLFIFQLKDAPRPIFSFLDRMTGTRLGVAGEGTWVSAIASKQDEKLNILLVNFDPTGSHAETVPVRISALPNGTYDYAQQYYEGRPTAESSKKQQEVVTDGSLSKQIHMPAQSIVLLELIPSPRH